MPGDSNGESGFSVSFIGLARYQFQTIARTASYRGRGRLVAVAMRQILDQLQTHPREFGEPLYDLRKIRMQVRAGSVAPLRVEYGVHAEKPVVIIRRVIALAEPEDMEIE